MSQLLEFVAAVIKALPGDISHNVQQGWIENPKALQKVLREALVEGESAEDGGYNFPNEAVKILLGSAKVVVPDDFNKVLSGESPFLPFNLAPAFDYDMRKQGVKGCLFRHGDEAVYKEKGWTLVKDSSEAGTSFEPELVGFQKGEGDNLRSKDDLLKRAQELGAAEAGQRHAETMLRQQERIPVEWRKYTLVFTGTIWAVPGRGKRLICLWFYKGRWYLAFRGFLPRSEDCLVRPRK